MSRGPFLPWLPLLLLAAASSARAQVPAGWSELGGSGTWPGIGQQDYWPDETASPQVALDSAGRPIVAWSATGRLYLERWDGTQWTGLGGSDVFPGFSQTPIQDHGSDQVCMAVDSSDRIFVAWREYMRDPAFSTFHWLHCVYLRMWDGSSWTELAGSGSGNGLGRSVPGSRSAWFPTMVLDPLGRPVVSWSAEANVTAGGIYTSSQIYMRFWNPGAQTWDERAGSASGDGISSNCPGYNWAGRVAVDAAGRPMVAWVRLPNGLGSNYLDACVYFKRLEGDQWVELADSASAGVGISGNENVFWTPGLGVDRSGNPVVAWSQYGNEGIPSGDIHLKAWTGEAWVGLDGSDTGGGISLSGSGRMPALTMDGEGRPCVGWLDGEPDPSGTHQLFLKRWSGSTWISPAEPPTRTAEYARPSIAIDRDGHPFVAWVEQPNGVHRVIELLKGATGSISDPTDGDAGDDGGGGKGGGHGGCGGTSTGSAAGTLLLAGLLALAPGRCLPH